MIFSLFFRILLTWLIHIFEEILFDELVSYFIQSFIVTGVFYWQLAAFIEKTLGERTAGNRLVSIKYNLDSFKERLILLCQSILELRWKSNWYSLALFTFSLSGKTSYKGDLKNPYNYFTVPYFVQFSVICPHYFLEPKNFLYFSSLFQIKVKYAFDLPLHITWQTVLSIFFSAFLSWYLLKKHRKPKITRCLEGSTPSPLWLPPRWWLMTFKSSTTTLCSSKSYKYENYEKAPYTIHSFLLTPVPPPPDKPLRQAIPLPPRPN